MNQIRCERTRRLIENFADYAVRPWNEILKDKADCPDTLDLISKMAVMDPEDRIDVHQAINHNYFREYYPNFMAERACPFKVGHISISRR